MPQNPSPDAISLPSGLTIRIGDIVDRTALDAAVKAAAAEGLYVRVFDPDHLIATTDYLPQRINIHLDENNRVTGLLRG